MNFAKGITIRDNGKAFAIKRFKRSLPLYLLLLPGLVYLLVFSYGPMYGVQIAFKNYRASRGIWGSEWVGLKHFIRFVKYPNFWKLTWNTLSITLLGLATFPLPILFALFLNEVRHVRFKKTVQMVTYMPHFLSEVVVCSLVRLFLDMNAGPLNQLIVAMGGEARAFMGEPDSFPWIMVLSGLWTGLGWESILYISALSSVPSEIVEAAEIDGANRMQVMWHINIPSIMPTIVITLLLQMGRLMSLGYSKILLLQTDLNLSASSVISTYTYEVGLLGAQFSYSSAIGLFNNVVNIIILVLANAAARKLSDSSLF